MLNELKRLNAEKRTENNDVAYNTTGNPLIDLLFMADFFTQNLEQVSIGKSEKEQLFAMYMRDPRDGKGYRDLGRKLMELAGNSPEEILEAGRFDDLWHIPTRENIFKFTTEIHLENPLARKWAPRLNGKYHRQATIIRKIMGLSEKAYRKLIKAPETVEYKLSYAEVNPEANDLEHLFDENIAVHPLLDEIDFAKVPSLAMLKYFKAFIRKDETSTRFAEYLESVKAGKEKLNTATARVTDAYKVVKHTDEESVDVLASKIVEQETKGLALNAICVLDTSGSMLWSRSNRQTAYDRAMAVAHALTTTSTYAPNQLISFSARPQLMTIKGSTIKEQYQSMHTGDCTNTNLVRVFEILKGLKHYPDFVIVLSDMEFDLGSRTSKQEWADLAKWNGANTRLIWWNFNGRNRTSPEMDEYGNFYVSGDDLSSLMMIPGVIDMEEYIDRILEEYAKKKFSHMD